jgi:CubicO group peptidase (beta-lactamase class C family)
VTKKRTETWLAVIVLAIGLPVAAVVGFMAYLAAIKAPPVHPNPNDVPSVILSTPAPAWAAAVDQGRQAVRAGLTEQNLPGVSVAVGVGGEIVWAEGFGWANIENKVPVAPGMRFRIGHVSKALTSAAVGLLLDKGRLHLGDEIQRYVPTFPRKQWPVTLRQLMAHTAGFKHYTGEYADVPSGHCDRASEGLQSFADDPLLFEPDTKSRYSTYGWVLVSAAVEAVAGEPFFTVMRTQIFTPLGMTATGPESAAEPVADRATFYFSKFTGDNKFGHNVAQAVDYSCFAGAGAFLSTPTDLVRFGMAMTGGTLLQTSTVRMLQSPQELPSGNETGFGLGWTVDTTPLAGEPTRLVSDASKSLIGGSTSFLIFPDRGIVVAIMTNTSYADPRSMALSIAQAFAEQKKSPARK